VSETERLVVVATFGQRDLQILAADGQGRYSVESDRECVRPIHQWLLDHQGSGRYRFGLSQDLVERVEEKLQFQWHDGRPDFTGSHATSGVHPARPGGFGISNNNDDCILCFPGC